MEGMKIIISSTHTPHIIGSTLYKQCIAEYKQAFDKLNKARPVKCLVDLIGIELGQLNRPLPIQLF